MKENSTIFISHSSQNIEIVQHFCTAIKALGVNAKNIFCSSIPGQGVNNGEKLNEAIFNAVNSCGLLIYFISYDFINSPYCVEELGIGWFRSQKGEAICFYLLIPDISFSEIGGFVNSKIDKFTVIDDARKDDFGLLFENICEELGLIMPKHSVCLNIEKVFFDAVRAPIEDTCNIRAKRKEEATENAERVQQLSEKISSLESQVSACNVKLEQEKERQKKDALKIEFKTIIDRFDYLGYRGGITKNQYNSLYKEFLLSMAVRYIELGDIFSAKDPDMEMLLACIFSHEEKLDEAYQHLVNYVTYSNDSIYPDFFENVEIDQKNDMNEIITILENRIQNERPGIKLDAFISTIGVLKGRAKQLKKRGKANA